MKNYILLTLIFCTNVFSADEFIPLKIVVNSPYKEQASICKAKKTGCDFKVNYFNRNITQVQAAINVSKGILGINFNYNSGLWMTTKEQVPFVIRLFDKNKQYLKHFITREKYIVDDAYRHTPKSSLARNILDKALKSSKKPLNLLKKSDNFFTFQLNQPIAQNLKFVEIGFWPKEPGRKFPGAFFIDYSASKKAIEEKEKLLFSQDY